MATALFNDVRIQHPDDHVGRKFKFLPVSKLLCSHENFSGGGPSMDPWPAMDPCQAERTQQVMAQ
ncbi:unnamed protein product [Chondrus crispus]|uniref:Uncharacterized protein n=1 Tax=Chondrus crispus TaxID=2769 RepID=R7QMJ1_CHOCR|nr:unnamed protein product [Chondrus crispus]CDF39732.1 unnamed protein product [Chondrus crispus]|eukprot:XP_005710026.1 unnamed protein product [Chondrus crispus]